MEKKKKITNNNISYFSFLNLNEDYSNEKEKENQKEKELSSINNELYLNIDSKNNLKEASENDLEMINQRIDEYNERKTISEEKEMSKQNLTSQIIKKFLNKLYPKCETSARKISLLISREIRSLKTFTKDNLEECINYFFALRHEIKYSDALKLTKDIFRKIGYILCYIYGKFTQFSMKESKGIKECILNIIEKNIDVLTDYFFYCEDNGLDPLQIQKTTVWKNLRKKYEIPPELIFLINIFHRMNVLDVNIDFDGEIITEEDLKLFTITILNINIILPKLEQINLNFIHDKLQFNLYKRYYTKIFNLLKISEENIKKNKIKNHPLIYDIKWDFENDFNLEEYRKAKLIKEGTDIPSITYDSYSILCCVEEKTAKNEKSGKIRFFNGLSNDRNVKNALSTKDLYFKKDFSKEEIKDNDKDFKNSILSKNFDDFELISDDEADISSIKTTSTKKLDKNSNSNKKVKLTNKKNMYLELLEKNAKIFDIILMTICGVTTIESIKKLIIISNDFYNRDLINYMIKYYGVDIASIDNEFHVLDMLYNKTNNLDLLNIEINALDIMSFDKIIGIIYKNQSLNTLKLSFFSSDVSYFIITLLKVYEEIKSNEQISQYVINQGTNFTLEKFEEKIVDDISQLFIDDLYLLFEIIKNKNNLEVLGLNFDLPTILINNANYKRPIFKLILNILFLIENNECKNNNKIKKLTLLSPYTIFDNRSENNIDELFKDIHIYKKCNVLKELNLQFQFYDIKYIKNLISTNLVVLSIGDLDIISFDKLVNYLTSYNFSINSALERLNIKLLNKITSFNTEIKVILRKLFNIKIKTLLELGLFTNLIINSKANYSYLIKILKYNWIQTYTIILNDESNKIIHINNNLEKDISFFVPSNLENIVFKESFLKEKKREKNNQKKDQNDEIFWILKYLFICRYSHNKLSFFEVQNLSFTILQFLYLTSNVKLLHKIEEEEKT